MNENECPSCGALMAPAMTTCPRCGQARTVTPSTQISPTVQPPAPAKPKSAEPARGLKQDIFGPNAIWVALVFFFAAQAAVNFGFVGMALVIPLQLFAYVINVGWTMRVANEKGMPAMGVMGLFPCIGPIIVACIPKKAVPDTPLHLATEAVDIPYQAPSEAEKAKFDLD